MTIIRGAVKRVVESALILGGAALVSRRAHSGHLLVLAYHNIVPLGMNVVGDRSLHLQQSAFAAQLDALSRTHDVIALDEPMTDVSTRQSRPSAIITFDDAYSGALTAGVAELRARGLPATIFVTPSFLDGGSFWWDTFADPLTGLNANLRHRALIDGKGLNAEIEIFAAHDPSTKHAMPPFARGASMQELHAALEYERITLAAHTWSHPNLNALPDNTLATELARPLEWLCQFGDRALPMLSYPYGLADQRVRNAACRAGYKAGFMIEGGWTSTPPSDPFAIPRLNVPAGVSRDGFVLRAAGLIQG